LQTEAQYAYNLEKTIVPLRLEAGYQPDGWLGPLCLNNFWYDFSEEMKFEGEWTKLKERLKTMQTVATAAAIDTGLTAISAELLTHVTRQVI